MDTLVGASVTRSWVQLVRASVQRRYSLEIQLQLARHGELVYTCIVSLLLMLRRNTHLTNDWNLMSVCTLQ